MVKSARITLDDVADMLKMARGTQVKRLSALCSARPLNCS